MSRRTVGRLGKIEDRVEECDLGSDLERRVHRNLCRQLRITLEVLGREDVEVEEERFKGEQEPISNGMAWLIKSGIGSVVRQQMPRRCCSVGRIKLFSAVCSLYE